VDSIEGEKVVNERVPSKPNDSRQKRGRQRHWGGKAFFEKKGA